MRFHIAIGSDHRGFQLKKQIIDVLSGLYEVEDLGCYSEGSCDYPDIAKELSNKIKQFGVLICNTGIGMSIAANSHSNLSAALCMNDDMVVTSRKHNNANTLVLGAKYLNTSDAIRQVQLFVSTSFDESKKNSERLKKIGKKVQLKY